MSAAPELDHPDRAGLISEISRIFDIDEISTSLWLCLWFADIERLNDLVEVGSQLDAVFQELSKRTLESSEDFDSVLRLWLARPVRVSETESNDRRRTEPGSIPDSSSSEVATSKSQGYSRDRKLFEACIARDEGRCQITRAGYLLEACPILSHVMNKRQATPIMDRFWKTLHMFWTQDKVEAWKDELEPNDTEILQNLITMTRQAHGYWYNARFALFPHKPSSDGKSMDVVFFWMPRPYVGDVISILERPSLIPYPDSTHQNGKLFNCDTDKKIASGTVITLRTSDPITHPLPSYALLQMQWYPSRIAGLSGAADFDNDIDEDGPSDDESDVFSD